jgi:hypothetical protein
MDFKGTMLADRNFIFRLGQFHSAWLSADITLDMAIGRFLKLTDCEAQILTSGMEFGPKARLLHELVKRSLHPRKREITTALNKLRNNAKRNILSHAYLIGDTDSVTFLERQRGEYAVKRHRFTHLQWQKHVTESIQAGADLWGALGYEHNELEEFTKASLNSARS